VSYTVYHFKTSGKFRNFIDYQKIIGRFISINFSPSIQGLRKAWRLFLPIGAFAGHAAILYASFGLSLPQVKDGTDPRASPSSAAPLHCI
jgi:hypothetical protein